jgi:hypothetical protein
VANVEVDFSEQAKLEGSSANMNVYLVNRKDETKVDPSTLGLELRINGEVSESIKITPDMDEVKIEILGGENTKDAMYYGRIHLDPSYLDNCAINCEECDFKWKFDFDQKINPLKLILIIIVILLSASILLWMIALKPMFYPRFGSLNKMLNIPGMAPLAIRFKGAREIVISASPQRKQSPWNRLWTGKIVYINHPAFQTPITFVPGRRNSILVRIQDGAYRVAPNPMPGIGAAMITDIRNNRQINVN